MKDNELTLGLEGEVTLEDFSKAMRRFREIVEGLENEVAPTSKIDWVIDSLQNGSAIASIRGIPVKSEDIEAVRRIRQEYIELGRKVVHGETLTNDPPVVQAVTELRKLINGRITSIRFETTEKKYVIKKHTIFVPIKTYWDTDTFGGARGRVQSISDRQYLHFVLYDYNDDHAIACSYPNGTRKKIRDVWGKFVYVEGIVNRDTETDLVTSIHDISNITVVKERKPQEWRKALGCAK